jgi:hypothetical protein
MGFPCGFNIMAFECRFGLAMFINLMHMAGGNEKSSEDLQEVAKSLQGCTFCGGRGECQKKEALGSHLTSKSLLKPA